jgi:hypothetical protein
MPLLRFVFAALLLCAPLSAGAAEPQSPDSNAPPAKKKKKPAPKKPLPAPQADVIPLTLPPLQLPPPVAPPPPKAVTLPAPAPAQAAGAPKPAPTPDKAPIVAAPPAVTAPPAAEIAPKAEPPPLVTSGPSPAPAGALQLGIYRLVPPGTEDDPAMRSIEDTFVDVAQASKRYRTVVKLPKPPKLCVMDDDKCFAMMGGFQQLDQVLVGETLKLQNGAAVKVRLVDVPTGKAIGTKAYTVASQDKEEIKVWAEALACDLINGTTCKGQAIIDGDLPEMRIVVDNLQYPRTGRNPETLAMPLGVHTVRVMVGDRASLERKILVSHVTPATPALFARQLESGGIALLRPQDMKQTGSLAASVSTAQLRQTRWTRPAGFTIAAAGLIVAGIAAYEGVHSKKLRDDANALYASHNGVYLQSDVATVDSARSAATAANVLFVVSAVVIAAGLTMAFAF